MGIASIGIVGGGSWGTALATVAVKAGRRALLWTRNREVVRAIAGSRENTVYLPGIALPDGLDATDDPAGLADCDAVLLVPPAQHLGETCRTLLPALGGNRPMVICAKGIERGTSRLMSEVLAEVLPEADIMVLSGPSFAADVARGLPTAVTLAGAGKETLADMAAALQAPSFRPYTSTDLVGAQIGGAVKNVLAIACGVSDGRELGASARAALITRGFAELVRFARARGARTQTLSGLSGMGDLVLTCSSAQSRNMSLGIELGRGRSLDEILAGRNSVSEGVWTAGALAAMAGREGIDMPICQAVDAILNRGADIDETMAGLLARPLKSETN